jgi:hypothetical protein
MTLHAFAFAVAVAGLLFLFAFFCHALRLFSSWWFTYQYHSRHQRSSSKLAKRV